MDGIYQRKGAKIKQNKYKKQKLAAQAPVIIFILLASGRNKGMGVQGVHSHFQWTAFLQKLLTTLNWF